jgi:hypothetical protein
LGYIDKIGDVLEEKLGLARNGCEILYNGMTGMPLEHEIFIGGFDSLGVIVNNNYKIESDNIEFELLIYNKNVRRLLLQ